MNRKEGTVLVNHIRNTLTRWVRNLENKQLTSILAIFVGIASGLATAVIKTAVHLIQMLLTSGFAQQYHNYLFFIYPLIGLVLTVLIIRFVIRQDVGHGIPNVLHAISKRNSNLKEHNMFSSILTSTITVGFGGSVGLEGPTVATGGAYGSYIGRFFRLDYKNRTLLVGCATAGALSAIFKAPIAAIVFSVEVIMLDLTMASLIPLLMASASAVITTYLFLGEASLLSFTLNDEFLLSYIPFYILLGIITGLVSVYFSKAYFSIHRFCERIRNTYLRAINSGVILGIMVFLFPPLYGEGYDTINHLIHGDYTNVLQQGPFSQFGDNIYFILLFLLALVFLKVIATAFTFGGGGIGGIFAPTLFMGSTLGFTFAKVFNYFGISPLSEGNFTLVGMAGLMAGVLHAPLTAIFLIAEITGGYALFVPLMIASAIAYTTGRYFRKHNVYTQQLAERGELMTHHKDQTVLSLMNLEEEIEDDFIKVQPQNSLRTLVYAISRSHRNLFPVVDEEDHFKGVVLMNDIRKIMFEEERYDNTFVEDLMDAPPTLIYINENMNSVMEKFEETGAWNLPVVDSDRKYIGFVSKSKLFSKYRNLLIEFSEE